MKRNEGFFEAWLGGCLRIVGGLLQGVCVIDTEDIKYAVICLAG